MKCAKPLFMCLILQTLLIIGEAGKNKKINFKPLSSTSNAQGTNAWGMSSGRVSPSRTNVGRSQARSPSPPNRPIVPSGPSGASAWQRHLPLNPRTSSPPGIPRSSAPSRFLSPAYPPLQAPGTHARPRVQSPVTPVRPVYQPSGYPVQPRAQSSGSRVWSRPQSPSSYVWSRPQSPGSHVWSRPQSPDSHVWSRPQSPDSQRSVPHQFNVPPVSRPQSPTTNFFPTLPQPKFTYSEAEKQREIFKSNSAGSMSSMSSGFSSGSRRSSIISSSSMGSMSSGSHSSTNIRPTVGLEAFKSTAPQVSTASPEKCRDSHGPTPTVAPAEHCFDYFKLAVIWTPGYAYKEELGGKTIRTEKISPQWIIHGLWPTMFDRMKIPMPTCSRLDVSYNQNHYQNNGLRKSLDATWYTILHKDFSDNSRLWENEFKKHGNCATRSNVIRDDVGYFMRTTELFNQLNIATTLFNDGIKPGASYELGRIINSIESRVGAKIFVNFITDQKNKVNYVTEMHICYDLNLQIMDCPNVYIPTYILNEAVTLPDRPIESEL